MEIANEKIIRDFFARRVGLDHYKKISTIHAIIRDSINEQCKILVQPFSDVDDWHEAKVRTYNNNHRLYVDPIGHVRQRFADVSIWDVTEYSGTYDFDIDGLFWDLLDRGGLLTEDMTKAVKQYEKWGPTAMAITTCDKFRPIRLRKKLEKDLHYLINLRLGEQYLNYVNREFVEIKEK